jgi:microcystin-dependent protein
MSDPFLAEVRIWACNFAPKGWAMCQGQLMAISQNTALFALIGTYYGGDGKSTFGLPNFQSAGPMSQGQSSAGGVYDLGQFGGSPYISLLDTESPTHTHPQQASNQPGEDPTPSNELLARSVGASLYQTVTNQNLVQLNPNALSFQGNGAPHNNMQPYLPLNFCIALQGIFPARP